MKAIKWKANRKSQVQGQLNCLLFPISAYLHVFRFPAINGSKKPKSFESTFDIFCIASASILLFNLLTTTFRFNLKNDLGIFFLLLFSLLPLTLENICISKMIYQKRIVTDDFAKVKPTHF